MADAQGAVMSTESRLRALHQAKKMPGADKNKIQREIDALKKKAPKAKKAVSKAAKKAKSTAKKAVKKAAKKAKSTAKKAAKKTTKAAKKSAASKSKPKAPKKATAKETSMAAKKKTSKKAKKASAGSKKKKRAAKKAAAPATTAAAAPAPAAKPKKKKGGKRKASAKKSGGTKRKASKRATKSGTRKRKSAARKTSKKGGRKSGRRSSKRKSKKSQTMATGPKMSKRARKAARGAKKKSRTTKYKKKGGGSLTIKQRYANPVNNWGNVAILGGGALAGAWAANFTDRMVATRAGDAKYPWYSTDAAARIMLRPDGVRIAAQAGLTVAFFVGSIAAQKRLPKLAYFLAGAAIGAGVHLGLQVINGWLMPKVMPVEKGNERNLGNRLYPMEQDVPQTNEEKRVEAETKTPASAEGQQGTDEALPPKYAYATPAATTNTTSGPRGNVAGAQRAGGGQLPPANRPRVIVPQGGTVGEPVARGPRVAPPPAAPRATTSTVGCGGQGCGRCETCTRDAQERQVQNIPPATADIPRVDVPPTVVPSATPTGIQQVRRALSGVPRLRAGRGEAALLTAASNNAFQRNSRASHIN